MMEDFILDTQALRKYDVLKAEYHTTLARQVNSKMNEGWVPLGGVSVGRDTQGSAFYQAMVLIPLTPRPILD